MVSQQEMLSKVMDELRIYMADVNEFLGGTMDYYTMPRDMANRLHRLLETNMYIAQKVDRRGKQL